MKISKLLIHWETMAPCDPLKSPWLAIELAVETFAGDLREGRSRNLVLLHWAQQHKLQCGQPVAIAYRLGYTLTSPYILRSPNYASFEMG